VTRSDIKHVRGRRATDQAVIVHVAMLLLGTSLATQSARAADKPSAVIVPRVPVIAALPADEVGRRQALLEIAEQSAKVGDAEVAADHADRAFELLPDARSALIAARAHLDRDRWTVALERLLVALDLGVTGPDGAAVKSLLDQLCRERALAYGKVVVRPEEARARLGSAELPVGRHFAVSAASHVIQVTAPGFVSSPLTLVATTGGYFLEEVALTAAPKEVESITTVKERIIEKDYVRFPPLWLTVAGGVLVLGGAGAIGGAYYYEGAATTYDAGTAERDQVEQSGASARIASYTLLGIGGAALLAGAIWWAVDDPPARVTSGDVETQPLRFAAFPWASPDGAGASALLHF
jgi:hypothetical protein